MDFFAFCLWFGGELKFYMVRVCRSNVTYFPKCQGNENGKRNQPSDGWVPYFIKTEKWKGRCSTVGTFVAQLIEIKSTIDIHWSKEDNDKLLSFDQLHYLFSFFSCCKNGTLLWCYREMSFITRGLFRRQMRSLALLCMQSPLEIQASYDIALNSFFVSTQTLVKVNKQILATDFGLKRKNSKSTSSEYEISLFQRRPQSERHSADDGIRCSTLPILMRLMYSNFIRRTELTQQNP